MGATYGYPIITAYAWQDAELVYRQTRMLYELHPEYIRYQTASVEAVLGIPMRVFGTLLIGFILFGVALHVTGAGRFFTAPRHGAPRQRAGRHREGRHRRERALRHHERERGQQRPRDGRRHHPRHEAHGFRPEDAAAVEANALSGGVLTPPVMGAVAFVMASILATPYVDIAVAAAVPAFLFSLSLFLQIDAYAAKYGIRGLPRAELPPLGTTFREGWFYAFAFAVLVVLLVYLRQEALAPFYATGALLVLAMARRETRWTVARVESFVFSSGAILTELVTVLAAVGLLIGVLFSGDLAIGAIAALREVDRARRGDPNHGGAARPIHGRQDAQRPQAALTLDTDANLRQVALAGGNRVVQEREMSVDAEGRPGQSSEAGAPLDDLRPGRIEQMVREAVNAGLHRERHLGAVGVEEEVIAVPDQQAEAVVRLGLARETVNIRPGRHPARQEGCDQFTPRRSIAAMPFWLVVGAKFLGNVCSQTLLVHQAAYLVDHGITPMVAASVISVVGVASIAGKTGGGWLSDHVDREIVYVLGMASLLASIAVLGGVAVAPSPWTACYAVLIGLGYAVTASLIPAILGDRFRGAHFGAIFGVAQVGSALGSALGAWLAGHIFDLTGSYAIALVVAAATALAAGVAVWTARGLRIRPRATPALFGAGR